jgi:protein-S-isoprenylcysteine O-methyltransferase Ste14
MDRNEEPWPLSSGRVPAAASFVRAPAPDLSHPPSADAGPAAESIGEAPFVPPRRKALLRSPIRPDTLRPRTLLPVAALLLVAASAELSAASLAVGLPLVVLGEAIRLCAAGYLLKTRELVTSGPYAHVRHPLYLGTLLIGLGLLAIAGLRVAVVGVPIGLLFFFAYYLPYKDRGERGRLEKRHGQALRAYWDAVPGLLPRLRPWRDPRPGAGTAWSAERIRDNSEVSTALAVVAAVLVVLAAGTWQH